MIVAGIGCRTKCAAETIVALIRRAAVLAQSMPELLALPAFKSDEPGPLEAATTLRMKLVFIDREALAAVQPRCVTRSSRVLSSVGLDSIAEAAALAAAGQFGQLILPRISENGATCALANSVPVARRPA